MENNSRSWKIVRIMNSWPTNELWEWRWNDRLRRIKNRSSYWRSLFRTITNFRIVYTSYWYMYILEKNLLLPWAVFQLNIEGNLQLFGFSVISPSDCFKKNLRKCLVKSEVIYAKPNHACTFSHVSRGLYVIQFSIVREIVCDLRDQN